NAENFREFYYQNQWNKTNADYVKKITGLIFIGFPVYGALFWEKFSFRRKIAVVILLFFVTLPKILIQSRFFVLYFAIFFCIRVAMGRFTKKTIIFAAAVMGYLIYYGFSIRFGEDLDLSKSVSWNINVEYIINGSYRGDQIVKGFLFDFTLIPTSFFDYRTPNMTTLKYGREIGSSEPMPVLANLYYHYGNYGSVFYFFIGTLMRAATTLISRNDNRGFILLAALLSMTVIYLNHSSVRGCSKYLQLILHWFLLRWIYLRVVKSWLK
ncbi:hypothetical protein N8481_02175, partial [Akkermansiaceae bacterium]|nr:hypothetical protein [Akkermansiaceae bacterium]